MLKLLVKFAGVIENNYSEVLKKRGLQKNKVKEQLIYLSEAFTAGKDLKLIIERELI